MSRSTQLNCIDHLDWSTLPAWMSYAEARKGQISFFNDIVYANVSGSGDFAKATPSPGQTLSGGISVDYALAIVELGGAYQVWSGRQPGITWLRRARSSGGRALLAPEGGRLRFP